MEEGSAVCLDYYLGSSEKKNYQKSPPIGKQSGTYLSPAVSIF